MPTEVGLVNEALVELGQTPIASLAGTDEISVACNTIYADTRDAVLLLHPWHFATYQIGLPVSVQQNVFKWGHIYELPDGTKYGGAPYCLKVLRTSEGEGALYELGQHTTGGRILRAHPLALGASVLAQLAAIPYGIEYTGRVTDLSMWDALALRLLVKLLASNLAKAVTGQTALAEEKLKEALALLPAAQKEQDEQGVGIGLYPPVESIESPLRVANQALALVGQDPIRSAAEDSLRAYHVRVHLATAQAAVLSRHPWNFATFHADLAESTTYGPPAQAWWQYVYDLPDGVLYDGKPYCLKVLQTDRDPGDRWEVANDGVAPGTQDVTSGRVLLTNAASCTIRYTGMVVNMGIWAPLAIEALTAMLASRLAPALLKDAKASAFFYQQALDLIREATRQDAKEGTPPVLRPNRFLVVGRSALGGLHIPLPPMIPGRRYGLDTYVLRASEAVSGGSLLVATGALPARTRIRKVVYDCLTTFGTSLGLASVDIGEATLQDRWGHAIGITAGTQTSFGVGLPGDIEVLSATDVWVSALGGLFDTVGECQISVYWERLGPT